MVRMQDDAITSQENVRVCLHMKVLHVTYPSRTNRAPRAPVIQARYALVTARAMALMVFAAAIARTLAQLVRSSCCSAQRRNVRTAVSQRTSSAAATDYATAVAVLQPVGAALATRVMPVTLRRRAQTSAQTVASATPSRASASVVMVSVVTPACLYAEDWVSFSKEFKQV